MEFSHRIVLFLLFTLSSFVRVFVVNGEIQEVLVDQLTSDYLKIEQSLWRVIEKREPSTLQQIYNIHTRFMGKDYGESNVLREQIYLKRNDSVAASIHVIDDVAAKLALEFFENRNYVALSAVAESGIQLERETDAIFSHTVNSTDFWESIHNLTQTCHGETATRESKYQVIFEYYKDVQALSLKTFIASQLSYMILHLHESGNYREQSIAYRQRFIDRNFEIKDKFRDQLATSNADVIKCVSIADQNAGLNTVNITNFLQGYVENEVALNPEGSCTVTCADYRRTYVANCQAGSICEKNLQRKCNGVLRNCHGISDSLDICLAMPDENRRYNWIKLDSGNKIGVKNGQCSTDFNVKSWIRWFVKCSNCFCLCDDTTDSDRHINLREVVSNIYENKIVTGIRIEKFDHVIQLQIIERELYSVLRGINRTESNIVLSPKLNLNDTELQDGIDYHKLTYESRSVSLDTVIAPPGHAVTGVRFHVNDGRLSIQIRATAFDFAGQLENLANSTWISRSSEATNQIKLNGRKLSTKATDIATPNEVENAYVEFGPTDFSDDLSQNTIPLIDSHLVEPQVPTILSGVGLIHKGQPGYGGFIAPKLVVYKFEPTIPHSDE